MTKFSGIIGFAETEETSPGIWEETIVERPYKGEVLRNYVQWNAGDKVNDDLSLNNSFSIVADPYAFAHIGVIRYVKWMGSCWKVTNIELQKPRLILTIGGVYNV